MPSGGTRTVRTGTRRIDAGNPWGLEPGVFVTVSVSDTGVGMDDKRALICSSRLFTTKEIGKGTGLSLFTAYAIVERSGGTITVDSVPGEGTTFEIFLPRSWDIPAAISAGEPETPGRLRGDAIVLVVEDEASVRNIIVQTLREVGYDVLVAPDPGASARIGQRVQPADRTSWSPTSSCRA